MLACTDRTDLRFNKEKKKIQHFRCEVLKFQLPRVRKDVTGVSLDPESSDDFTTGTLNVNPICYEQERFFRATGTSIKCTHKTKSESWSSHFVACMLNDKL